jgi:hypothetical protein
LVLQCLWKNFGRTHKQLEAVAVADSQADHCSLGTPAEAAEGSNLDQAVALSTDTPINDTGAIATNQNRNSHLEGDNMAVVDDDRSNLC